MHMQAYNEFQTRQAFAWRVFGCLGAAVLRVVVLTIAKYKECVPTSG